ncbi:hypothetical protein BVX93_02355, partial [bacterium B13(2017)]
PITLEINTDKRKETEKNHTATHVLQYSLRKHLGNHVKQAGSFVNEKYLRFDFSHHQKMSEEELIKVEDEVNDIILKNVPVNAMKLSLQEAKTQEDILANFGEKYGDEVRLINVEGFSKELCGGTHIKQTGLINGFKILSESSVSAGIRRIEAITGKMFIEKMCNQSSLLQKISLFTKSQPNKIIDKIESLNNKIKNLEKQLQQSNNQNISDSNIKMDLSFNHNDIKLIIHGYENSSQESLLKILDHLKAKNSNAIIFLSSIFGNKIHYLSARTGNELVSCNDLIQEINRLVDGKGGGRANMARGGGNDISKLEESLNHIVSHIKALL